MSEGRRRISTIYSILCKWRVEGSPREGVKRKEGRRREGKTEGKVERVIRSECGPQLLSSSDINFTVEEKGERANETIRREREESESNPIYRMSLSLSLFLELCLDTQGQRSSALPPFVSSRKNGARTTSPTGCPRPFPTPSFEYSRTRKGTSGMAT